MDLERALMFVTVSLAGVGLVAIIIITPIGVIQVWETGDHVGAIALGVFCVAILVTIVAAIRYLHRLR